MLLYFRGDEIRLRTEQPAISPKLEDVSLTDMSLFIYFCACELSAYNYIDFTHSVNSPDAVYRRERNKLIFDNKLIF